MNLNTENAPQTIDIQSGNEKISFSKIKNSEEKKGTGRVIKESYIGFNENDPEREELIEETKEIEPEKEEIKQTGITAKDLFKQHIKNKVTVSTNDSNTTTIETSKQIEISPISKVVSSINDEKTINTEIIKEKEQIPVEEIIKKEPENIKTYQNIPVSKSTNAADSLLKKIEEKKLRMKEEKEREDREKLLEKQRVIEYIQNTPIEEEVKKSTEIAEPIVEANIESDIIKETPIKIENSKNDLGDVENINKPEKINKTTKLIDNFIEKIESLEKIGSKESSITGDASITSADEKEEFMTETMADIQIQQKNYPKAIEIYQKLILKFPEKKTYFAIQIKKVERLTKS